MIEHRELYLQFKHMFPEIDQAVTWWGQYGPNSIQLDTTAKVKLIFSYDGVDTWRLETIKRRMESGK